jgi:hypothetical protein
MTDRAKAIYDRVMDDAHGDRAAAADALSSGEEVVLARGEDLIAIQVSDLGTQARRDYTSEVNGRTRDTVHYHDTLSDAVMHGAENCIAAVRNGFRIVHRD